MLRTIPLLLLLLLTGCATSPLGRSQLKFLPDEDMTQMGITAFSEVKQQSPEVRDPGTRRYVTCVADHITGALAGAGPRQWEVAVFRNDEPNAFALPGGKIGVYTGILSVAENQHQLATVIAHEVAHVIAEHPNERVSTTYATQIGVDLVGTLATGEGGAHSELMGLLGVGAQYGFLLPFTRTQESEADLLGLDLMAKAGFNPRESVRFWQNMQRAGGSDTPEFLSTHPSGNTRMADLNNRMGQAVTLYDEARARGRRPRCD